MIKALILEDEPYIREALKIQLKRLSLEISIVGESETVKDALRLNDEVQPDLVFLDVNLKDGNGFDFLEQVERVDFNVIFVTAYEEYVLKALKFGAIDYILKPIDEEELNDAIQKVLRINENQTQERIKIFKDEIKGENERIVLRMQDCYKIVNYNDIIYCKADGGYTNFFLTGNGKTVVSKPLKDFAQRLPTNHFVRTHQSYLINIAHVDKYDKARFIYLKDGTKIPVSTRKKELVISKIFGEF